MHKTTRFLPFLLVAACGLCVCSAHAETYYWIGGASGNWDDGDKWSLTDGGAAAGDYPSDYSVDEAYVTSAATITLPSGNANVSNLYVNANVSFASGKIHAKTISGSGKLTMLDGTAFYASEYRTVVSVDVEVPSGATVQVSNNGSSKNYGFGVEFTADCALTGSGTIVFDSYRSSNPLYWDASGFSGTVVIEKDSQSRNNTQIRSASATHVGMSWQIDNTAVGNFIAQEGSYELGSLSGSVYIIGGNKAEDYAFVKNVTMKIGGLNGNDELGGQVSRNAGRSEDGAYIRKVGTGVLSSSVKGVNSYYIKEGVLEIASDDGLSVKDDSGNPGTGLVFEGGTLRIAEGVAKDVSAYIARGAGSTSPVIFDDEGRSHTWATALGNTLSGGLTKKGSGTLTLAAAPAYTGTTTLEGGVLVVPQGTTIAELSLTGGKLAVPLTGTENETAVLTISALAEGSTAEGLEAAVAIPGATMTVESDGGAGYVVKATRLAKTFTWTGASGSDWSNSANWQVGGEVAVDVPLAADMIVFPSEDAPWSVTLHSMPTIAALKVDGNTTFSGSRIQVADGAETAAVTGDGKITLGDNAGFYPGDGENLKLTVSNNLEIVAGESAPAKIQGRVVTSSSGGATIRIEGNLTGSGYVELGGTRSSTYINGDNREFAGYVTIPDDTATAGARRLNVYFKDENAVSSNAVWTIYNYNGAPVASGSSRVYCFGALMGEFNNSTANSRSSSWFELGAANTDFALKFTGVNYGEARQDKIRKVGTGTMTLNDGSGYIREYEFVDGSVCLVGDAAAPSVSAKFFGGELKLADTFTNDISGKIVSSTSPIVFDDGDTNRTWATALAASNVGGLTKKGAGTLTLTAVPLYTGLTTVEAGTLVVPEGTELSYNALSDTNLVSGATITNYAYEANTALTAPETSGSVVYDAPLNIANIVSIDASGVTLKNGQPYVVASATAITGYNKAKLNAIELTLPDGVDASKWVLKVMTIGNARCLCVSPSTTPFRVILR